MKTTPFTPLALSIFLCSVGKPTDLIASHIWVWGGQGSVTNAPADLTNAVALAAGQSHALALKSDGRVIAWGDDNYQQIDVPAQLSNVVAIAAGDNHSLALRADGTVTAWGANDWGQSSVPSGLANVIAVSAGGPLSVALKADGTVVGWGGNDSGWGLITSNVTSNMKNVIAISAGFEGCFVALSADRTLNTWGLLLFSPPQIASNIVGIALGGSWSGGYIVQLLADGSVAVSPTDLRCNLYPSNLTNVIQVAVGNGSCIALKADGTVAVWGCGTQPPPGLSGATSVCVSSTGGLFLALADIAQPKVPVSISFVAPLSQTVAEGSQAQFSVSASGSPPLSYQWYFGTNALAGATNRSLSLNNVQFSQAGTYSVAVSNLESFAISQPVTLGVQPLVDLNMVPAITLKGIVGTTYRIDYLNATGPTNAWNVLATVTLTNTQQFYCDLTAIGQPARYYRLVQVP